MFYVFKNIRFFVFLSLCLKTFRLKKPHNALTG